MTPLAWMIGVSVTSWALVAALVAPPDGVASLAGMAGPLVAVCATWQLVARTHARQPSRVMAVMVGAFGVKMVFFGAYVVLMLWGLSLRPVAFVVSFTGYFIALYAMEGWYLHRLFASRAPTSDAREW
jgi:hypothetical protein